MSDRLAARRRKLQQESSEFVPSTKAPGAQPGGGHPILQLQRSVGNRQVTQLIQQGHLAPSGAMVGVQPKLTVGAVDDPHEREADRMARHVMATSDEALANSAQRAVSRVESNGSLQPRAETSMAGTFEAGASVESQVGHSKGGGSQLPENVRSFMEPRFGADFGNVRVHTGPEAAEMNREIGAQAFTHGADIYYGEGRGPANSELTAHELTHVVQQTGGRAATSDGSAQRSPNSQLIQRIGPAAAVPAVAAAIKGLTFAEAITAVGTVVSSAATVAGLVGTAQNDQTNVSNDSILDPRSGDYMMSDTDRDGLAQVFRVLYFHEVEQLVEREEARGTVLDDAKQEELKQTAMGNVKFKLTRNLSARLDTTTDEFVQQGDGGTSKETPWGAVNVTVEGGTLLNPTISPLLVEIAERHHVTVPERTLPFIKRVKMSYECEKDWNLTWNDDIWVRGTGLSQTQDSDQHVGIEAEVAFDWDGDTTRYEWSAPNLIAFDDIPVPAWRGAADPDD